MSKTVDSLGDVLRAVKSTPTGAVMSDDERHRYFLHRLVAADGDGDVLWVMLNPSTADASTDDPTVRRCIGFTRMWGYKTLSVVNLFGFRATKPSALRTTGDPVGPLNDSFIEAAQRLTHLVVCAWGASGSLLGRDARVIEMLTRHAPLFCLGKTSKGKPRHPLYLRRELAPMLFRESAVRQ